MKKIKWIMMLLLLVLQGCQDDDVSLDTILVPSGLTVATEISDDGSGKVTFTAMAEHAITYKYVFPDGTSQVAPSGVYTKRFTKTGLNTYNVVVIAYGAGGVSSSLISEVTVQSDFSDEEALEFLTGGGSKTWYWAANEPGHLGVGQNNSDGSANFYANYYQAAPFEKAGEGSSCLYTDELTFSLDGGTLRYSLNNNGQTFFNVAYESVVGGSVGFDYCYDLDTSGSSVVNLAPSESFVAANGVPGQTRGTVMNFSDNNFMGYYIGSSSYEILEISSTRMVVRAVQGNNAGLAWYHIFTTTKPSQDQQGQTFDELVWSDEFDTDGAPNSQYWSYDLGTGSNGWGNNESQYYTDRPDNVSIADGVLKITAKAESYQGSAYTSARIKTENAFEFTYGMVEIRAKLPEGAGTWPALWMLGANFSEVGWPNSGEIDIMEYAPNRGNIVSAALHYPGNSGGNAITGQTTLNDATTAFHVYKLIWTAEKIEFFVDDTRFHSMNNSAALPFNQDFFLIFNVAMGGTFGGAIAPEFAAATMEVDYVRVYQ